MIHENLKAALAAKRRPNPFRCWAGTQPCPECQGNPRVVRHTPNFERFFNLQLPWDFKVGQREGYVELLTDGGGLRAPAAPGDPAANKRCDGVECQPHWHFSAKQNNTRIPPPRYPPPPPTPNPTPTFSGRVIFLEYPSKPPPLPEGRRAEPSPKVLTADKEGGFAMTAKDQFKLDDYVLRYVEDEDDAPSSAAAAGAAGGGDAAAAGGSGEPKPQ